MEEHDLLLTQPPSPTSIASQRSGDFNVASADTSPSCTSTNNQGASNENYQAGFKKRPSIDDLFEFNDEESNNEFRKSIPFSAKRYEEALRDLHSSGSSDDDESSISSSDSNEPDILKKRERNVMRNDLFLSKLHAKYHSVPTTFEKYPRIKVGNVYRDDLGIEYAMVETRGMLFNNRHRLISSKRVESTSFYRKGVRRLRELYPFREYQINILSSLIDASVGQIRRCQQSDCVYVPAPMLVTGPNGTGKTSVVRDVINAVKRGRESLLKYAYVDCAILEPSSIDRLVASAVSQLLPLNQRGGSKQKRKKRRRNHSVQSLATSQSHSHLSANSGRNGDFDRGFPRPRGSRTGDNSVSPTDVHFSRDRNVKCYGLDERNDPKVFNEAHRRTQLESVNATRQQIGAQQPTIFSPQRDGKSRLLDTVWSSNSVVSSFGRTLQPVIGRGGGHGAILVLDHADRLMSLSMKKASNDRTNFLSELLLLPKAMELNLTIIVITSNCCLDSSRKSET